MEAQAESSSVLNVVAEMEREAARVKGALEAQVASQRRELQELQKIVTQQAELDGMVPLVMSW